MRSVASPLVLSKKYSKLGIQYDLARAENGKKKILPEPLNNNVAAADDNTDYKMNKYSKRLISKQALSSVWLETLKPAAQWA